MSVEKERRRIEQLLPLLVKLGNRTVDWRRLFREAGIPEDRTMKIVIVDAGVMKGIALKDGRLVLAEDISNPTVTVYMTSNVFWAMITGKMSAYEAWLRGLISFSGDFALRDAVLLTRLFDELRRVVERVVRL